MKYCKCNENIRLITGSILDFDDNVIANATVVLLIRYFYCCEEYTKKIAFITTNNCGEFAFTIDITDYINCEFILEVFNPIQKI